MVRADLLVEGGIAAALALVAAAVVARPTLLAPEMIQHLPTFSCRLHSDLEPAISAFALPVAGAEVPPGAPRAVDVVALAVSAVDAEVEVVGGALAHPAADARAAAVADHARVLGILATRFKEI